MTGARVEVRGPRVRLAGEIAPPAFQFPRADEKRHRVTFAAPDGGVYYVVSKKNESLPTDGFLWMAALKHPAWLARYGIHADDQQLLVPTLETFNRILEEKGRGPFSVGHRLEVLSAKEPQEYTEERFFRSFVRGKIPMARSGSYGAHDFFEEHVVGALMIPPPVFARLVLRARQLEALGNDPELMKLPELKRRVEERQSWFSGIWDRNTFNLVLATFQGEEGAAKIKDIFSALAGEFRSPTSYYELRQIHGWEAELIPKVPPALRGRVQKILKTLPSPKAPIDSDALYSRLLRRMAGESR